MQDVQAQTYRLLKPSLLVEVAVASRSVCGDSDLLTVQQMYELFVSSCRAREAVQYGY